MKTLALPTTVYLAVTVAAPGINGGFQQEGFWVHTAWVLLSCACVVAALGLARRAFSIRRR